MKTSTFQNCSPIFFRFWGPTLQQQLDCQYVNPRAGKNKQNFTWNAHLRMRGTNEINATRSPAQRLKRPTRNARITEPYRCEPRGGAG